ncbi:pyridoxal 5'-phosphate synthase glutaminase subunit PdxT [bacterium]|nr:pyridoxal 5'-phosphate synthase glutaminase subunit PdxT [bacterium]HPF36542.1 pyridoxal 5'-phosphate synthase glutaminase subunit PdxT [Candidatus Krumholzibacteria bacterium]HRX52404.1 pyridoxal 5'-phosphate synthase glutaminase subunit PdxT [Candidatus Krumholzibacteria bacterium]
MTADRPIGVLALQGDFELHEQALDRLGRPHVRVRRAEELDGVSALILPGGESTTMTRLIDRVGLRAPLLDFAASGRTMLGTCAGLILLATRIEEDRDRHGVEPLGLLDVLVRRNGFGRQVDSFVDDVTLADGGRAPGVFIRAPRILQTGAGVEVIARWGEEPVAVRAGNIVGLTFHPEANADGDGLGAFLG